MDKIENIDKVLYTYSIYDKETQKFDVLLTAYNDADACKYYLNEFEAIKKAIKENFNDEVIKIKLDLFLDRIHNSIIYCVGSFDFSTGEFTNSKKILLDLFDFKFNVESEDNNNVK